MDFLGAGWVFHSHSPLRLRDRWARTSAHKSLLTTKRMVCPKTLGTHHFGQFGVWFCVQVISIPRRCGVFSAVKEQRCL